MKTRILLCTIVILCCILAGCSRNEATKADSPMKGRYVEKSIPLPEGVAKSSLVLTRKADTPFLYSYDEQAKAITGYQFQSGGTWVDATPGWLKTLDQLPEGWSYKAQVLEDGRGYQYFYYTELIKDSLKSHLLCSKDGKTAEELYPEGWDEAESDTGYYNSPSNVTILEDGTLAAVFYSGEVITYDSETYKIKNTISDVRYYSEFLSSMGNSLILGESDDSMGVKGVIVYDLSTGTSASYPIELSIDSQSCWTTDGQNILLCSADGIFRVEDGTTTWNNVVDGSLTSLAMPTMWFSNFTNDASDNYYVLFNSDAGYHLMQYTYDKTVDTIPSKELKIYSLCDNSTLRQAIAEYQQQHTDVKVNFTTAMTKEEYDSADSVTKEDYIRALNTELLAGDSYDILVLDGLPADAFIEKGILVDLSDVLKPMLAEGTLYKNIADCYQQKDKIFRIPARFGVNVIMGKTADTLQLTTLQALSDYAAKQTERSPFGFFTADALVDTFLPYQLSTLMGEDGKINRDRLIAALNTLKQLCGKDGLVDNYDTVELRGNNIWNLTSGDYLSINTTKSFLDAMYSFGIMTHIKGSYASFENSFTPSCEIGINSNGKQIELSKDFLKTLLSEKVQSNDLYDGFPVNPKATQICAAQDRSNYSAATSVVDENGVETMLTFTAIDKQITEELVNLCSKVNNKVTPNERLGTAIKEKAKNFLSGNQSAEDAADSILEETNLYLSE